MLRLRHPIAERLKSRIRSRLPDIAPANDARVRFFRAESGPTRDRGNRQEVDRAGRFAPPRSARCGQWHRAQHRPDGVSGPYHRSNRTCPGWARHGQDRTLTPALRPGKWIETRMRRKAKRQVSGGSSGSRGEVSKPEAARSTVAPPDSIANFLNFMQKPEAARRFCGGQKAPDPGNADPCPRISRRALG